MNSPAIFSLDRNGKAIFTKNTFGDILKKMTKDGTLSKKYILKFLRQIFTNVRIKDLVEIRGADRTPEGFEIAPAAFWTGLLTETYVRDIVIETTSHWTKQDRLLLNNSALSLNKDQKGPSKKKYGDWIDYFSELALEGLRRRQFGEEHLLGDYLKIIKEKGPFTLQNKKMDKRLAHNLTWFPIFLIGILAISLGAVWCVHDEPWLLDKSPNEVLLQTSFDILFLEKTNIGLPSYLTVLYRFFGLWMLTIGSLIIIYVYVTRLGTKIARNTIFIILFGTLMGIYYLVFYFIYLHRHCCQFYIFLQFACF